MAISFVLLATVVVGKRDPRRKDAGVTFRFRVECRKYDDDSDDDVRSTEAPLKV